MTYKAYVKGQLVDDTDASISIFDSAVLIGDSVLEVTRTFHHRLFRWDAHRDRLLRSIKGARLALNMSVGELDEVTQQFLEANLSDLADDDEAAVGHLVSRGDMGLVREATDSTFLMSFVPASKPLSKTGCYYDTGRHVVTPPTRHMHPSTVDPKIKYRSRLHFAIADAEAKLVDPEAIPLMLDHQGNLAEGTGWNFFVVSGGELHTPTTRNILAGISRMTTIELARDAGLIVHERDIQLYDAQTADEAFLTATSLCMMPVTRFNGQPIGDGQTGPVTRRLMKIWREHVDFDFVAHAKRAVSGTFAPTG